LLKSHCKHYVGDVCSGPCCFTVMWTRLTFDVTHVVWSLLSPR
jgi:hypothetical protein